MPHAPKHGRVTIHPVKSSNLSGLGYEPDKHELHVEFKSGHAGHYSNVDYNTFTVLMAAPAKGKALHALVKQNPQKYPWHPREKEK
jgi:KTSC domain